MFHFSGLFDGKDSLFAVQVLKGCVLLDDMVLMLACHNHHALVHVLVVTIALLLQLLPQKFHAAIQQCFALLDHQSHAMLRSDTTLVRVHVLTFSAQCSNSFLSVLVTGVNDENNDNFIVLYNGSSGTVPASSERKCEPGSYCVDGIRHLCPAGRFGATYGLVSYRS